MILVAGANFILWRSEGHAGYDQFQIDDSKVL